MVLFVVPEMRGVTVRGDSSLANERFQLPRRNLSCRSAEAEINQRVNLCRTASEMGTDDGGFIVSVAVTSNAATGDCRSM